MKTLNLDDFATDKRAITFKGVEHEVREMSVEDFIAASGDAKKLEEKGEKGMRENVEDTIVHLRRAIPSLEEAELRGLTVAQLVVLVRFVNGTLEDEADKGAEVSGN